MTDIIEVEWVGGPRDGERFQMLRADVVRWAEAPPPLVTDETYPEAVVPYHEMQAPVRLTRNGYRAYYEERTT